MVKCVSWANFNSNLSPQVQAQIRKIFEKHSVSEIPPMALVGMIESPQSLMNMRQLCKSAAQMMDMTLVALVFGSDDYCASLGRLLSVLLVLAAYRFVSAGASALHTPSLLV